MQGFTNILFCPLGKRSNAGSVRRVADLAVRSRARFTLFGVVAEPSRFDRLLHRPEWSQTIEEAQCAKMERKLEKWSRSCACPEVETIVETGNQALAMIQQVITAGHDLVVVTSDEDREDHATIKRLLRKCPCPVWVIRPTRAQTQRVLACVNPDPEEAELNRTILELASLMVEVYGGELHVVHAWELYAESTLRSSPFLHVSEAEIEAMRHTARAGHKRALNELLESSTVADAPWEIHLKKGPPAQVVSRLIDKQRINLLVMGTVARGGISGALMGNIAEQVLDEVRCSVIAVKPAGFVSPLAQA